MKNIVLNNYSHRLYTLPEIKETCEKLLKREEGPNAPFSYAAYAGTLEAHYSLLCGFVERLVKDADKLELVKEYEHLIEERAKELALAR